MRVVIAFVIAPLLVVACLDSPDVTLVDAPDASSFAADASDGGAEAATERTPKPKPGPTPPSACDARCTASGGACDGDVCVITCPGAEVCDQDIACPTGMSCKVQCVGKQACRNVTCRDAKSCTILCDGDSACSGKVSCSGDACAVTCQAGGCKPDDVRCCSTTCTLNGAALTCP